MSLTLDRRFFKFLLVGGLNTLFGYALFTALVAAGLSVEIAMGLGTVGGIFFNFKTTGSLVFASRDNALLWRFVANYALLYLLNWGALKFLMGQGLGVYPASALLVLPMAAVSFVSSKTFVFRSQPPRESDQAP